MLDNLFSQKRLVMKALTWSFLKDLKVVRCGLAQRIIAIQGVSLVRILNLPSLDRSVGEILNIVSLEGESQGSAAHERFSREILPTDDAGGDI